jgi:predicted nucleic-acid-binding protein
MKAIADTNVLVRMIVDDDPAQSQVAVEILESAELVVVGLQALCELVWILHRSFGTSRRDIAVTIRQLLDTEKIIVNRPAVEAGLAVLDAGGDFADGIIAFEGSWLGSDTFVTFDDKASRILTARGYVTRLLKA